MSEQYDRYVHLLESATEPIFITGRAGTGKSTLIQEFVEKTNKDVVVLAPTGIAALNVGGQTIHSFFWLPIGLVTPDFIKDYHGLDKKLKGVDIFIIDEVSMLRADLLDGIDHRLRKYGRDKNQPFGGAQMIFVGDLYQLPPVLTNNEKECFNSIYENRYFFSAKVLRNLTIKKIVLNKIYRQSDEMFIEVLNKCRLGNVSENELSLLNNNIIDKDKVNPKAITMSSVNRIANSINKKRLDSINATTFTYQCILTGSFLEKATKKMPQLPADETLLLKEGARVVFIANDACKPRRYVNGDMGTVETVDNDDISVTLDSGELVSVERHEWDDYKYQYSTENHRVERESIGTFVQYPIRLAWAITIHKSQGLTFDHIHIDMTRAPFESGQLYVALSRCRTLDGLSLSDKIWPNNLFVDERINRFMESNPVDGENNDPS